MNAADIDVEERLSRVVDELARQPEVGKTFPTENLVFDEQIAQLREFLYVGECPIAYECLVLLLESFPFQLSGPAAVALLEVGLFYGFKTERDEDIRFNWNRKNGCVDKNSEA